MKPSIKFLWTLDGIQKLVGESGFTPATVLAMMTLSIYGGHTVAELAKKLYITQQATGKMLVRLEDYGYVSINQSKIDGRFREVKLTEAGRLMIGKLQNVWESEK